MPERLRVAIAEDHFLVREGTRRSLEDTDEIEVVAAVGTATELIDAVAQLAPDAVVTDIRMPPGHGTEGIEAAHHIRAAHPGTGVVILSQYADETYAFALLADGTAGLAYLLKERVGEIRTLVSAIRSVAEGGSVIDPTVVEALIAHRAKAARSPLAELTERELDVLGGMARGQTNAAIAASLHLSASSIEKHGTSIFAKLGLAHEDGVHRRVAAVLTFLREIGRADDL